MTTVIKVKTGLAVLVLLLLVLVISVLAIGHSSHPVSYARHGPWRASFPGAVSTRSSVVPIYGDAQVTITDWNSYGDSGQEFSVGMFNYPPQTRLNPPGPVLQYGVRVDTQGQIISQDHEFTWRGHPAVTYHSVNTQGIHTITTDILDGRVGYCISVGGHKIDSRQYNAFLADFHLS